MVENLEANVTPGQLAYTCDQGTYGIVRLTGISDASGTVSYAYDGWGRLIQEDRTVLGVVYTTEYAYNDNNDLTVITYPSGRTVTYQYDAAGRAVSVETANGGSPVTLASNGTYQPFGPLSGLTFGNGVSMTRNFDQRYRMTSRDFAGSNYLTVAMTERLPQVYAYDDLNRVTSANVTPGQSAYTYDTAGNRLTRTLGTESDVYTYDGVTGRLQSVTGSNPVTITYDASGRTTGLGSLTLTYNDRGRLAQVSNTQGTLGQYTYNALEQRIIKTAGGVTTVFLYDRQGRLISESSSTGTIQREYIYFNGEPLALVENGSTYYFANDHLGSGQALFDQYGETVWQASYDPFGAATVSPDSTLVNNLRLPGQYFDSETGLHYNWHRFYDPDTGRYVSVDPTGLDGGMNLYVYASDNPVNSFDPNGQFPLALPIICAGGGCEAIAGAITGIGLGIGVLWNNLSDSLTDSEEKCEEKPPKTCASEYPNLKTCNVYKIKGYFYNSKREALNYFRIMSGVNSVKCDQKRLSRTGPCAGKDYHYRITGGASHLGSITSCPCCEDTVNGPVKKDVWMVH